MTENTPYNSLDSTDLKIVRQLHKDARMEATKVAKEVDVHERTVRNRIDHMVESGAIRLVAILEPRAVGFTSGVHVLLEVEPEAEEEVVEKLQGVPELSFLAHGLEERNLLLVMGYFEDNEGVRKFLRHTLREMSGVRVIKSVLISRVMRDESDWLPGFVGE